MTRKFSFAIVAVLTGFTQYNIAQTTTNKDSSQRWNLHFQETIVTQHHAGFTAKYTGANSLLPNEDAQTSLTSTLFLGFKAWKGAAIYFNPEIAGGAGL